MEFSSLMGNDVLRLARQQDRASASRFQAMRCGRVLFRRSDPRGAVASRPTLVGDRIARSAQFVESLGEATGVGTLGLRQGLEPVGDFVEAFLAGCAGHARIHISVFVCLTRDCRREVLAGRTNRQTGCRVTGLFQKLDINYVL